MNKQWARVGWRFLCLLVPFFCFSTLSCFSINKCAIYLKNIWYLSRKKMLSFYDVSFPKTSQFNKKNWVIFSQKTYACYCTLQKQRYFSHTTYVLLLSTSENKIFFSQNLCFDIQSDNCVLNAYRFPVEVRPV